MQNADLKHNSLPDSAPCKLYIFSYMASNFEILLETLDRQTTPFCGHSNADGQDTVSISSHHVFFASSHFGLPSRGDARDWLKRVRHPNLCFRLLMRTACNLLANPQA